MPCQTFPWIQCHECAGGVSQDRLEKLKVDRIRHKVEEVQKALEKRRQRDVSRMQAVESQFKAVMTVREACLKAARARVQNKPSTSAAGVSYMPSVASCFCDCLSEWLLVCRRSCRPSDSIIRP